MSEKCPLADFGARGTAALVRAVRLWDRLPRDRGGFGHIRSKGLAKVLNAARKLAPLVPHNSEGFAQRLALVGDPGQPQRITMRLHNGWNHCNAKPGLGKCEQIVRHAALEQTTPN